MTSNIDVFLRNNSQGIGYSLRASAVEFCSVELVSFNFGDDPCAVQLS